MYKVANDMSPEIMNDIFKLRENTHYSLRHNSQFLVNPTHSVFNSSKSVSYSGYKTWEQTPLKLKILIPLLVLKKKLENGNLRIVPVEFAKFTYPI